MSIFLMVVWGLGALSGLDWVGQARCGLGECPSQDGR